MQHVTATRTELLARRERIDVARQGRDLLEEKRGALMRELRALTESTVGRSAELEGLAASSRAALAQAAALDAPEAVASASLAAAGRVELELSTRQVAGVRLVDVQTEGASRAPTARGYSLSATSARVERVAARYERLIDALLDTAAAELSLRRVATELGKTTRRVNALEQVVVPGLERERDAIALTLEEREREDRARLKRAKERSRGRPGNDPA